MEETKGQIINRWIYIILIALIILLSVWGIYNHNKQRELAMETENQYRRAFSEMTGYVEGIETQLNKSMLAGSAAQTASIAGEIFRQSTAAKACLGQLPTTEIQLDNTAKFLSQVGDYTYVLSQNMINGEGISDEDFENLKNLTEYASSLNESLSKIQDGIYDGTISFTEEKKGFNTASAAGNIFADLENVEKSFEDYPSLIYDGPFSEHIENKESEMLKEAEEISLDDALKKAKEFLGGKGENLVFESDTKNTAIDAYTFVSYTEENEISICVTKKGGYVSYFLDNREFGSEKLNFSEAVAAGEKFLKKCGITSMVSSYYEKRGGCATVNFAYVKDGVVCYSDLIKVKVALDNGEIVGMEAKGYLMNHRDRNLENIILSKDEAKRRVSTRLNVEGTGMALIPKDNLEEVLCYEFHGNFGGRNFIIYVNAQNGREEKILLLIESENGILTV